MTSWPVRQPRPKPSTRRALTDREFGEVLTGYRQAMERRGVLPSSIRVIVPYLQRWFVFVERRPVAGHPPRRRGFIDSLGRSAPRTRYDVISHLHRFYWRARRERLTSRDPTEFVDRPRLRRGLPRPIHDTDLALAITLADPPMRAALLLGCTSGLRALELGWLRWEDTGEDWLRVHGKGERVLPLHPIARGALDVLDRPDEWVLPWRATPDRGGVYVSFAVNRYLHGIGSSATCHQLRHWFGTKALVASGGDLRAVQELLGHASPATTAIYTALDPGRLREVIAGIIPPVYDMPAAEQLSFELSAGADLTG